MIIDTEKWQEILKTLGQHKLRTALTAFGVFWGIFMLTVLLGSGKGLENGVNDGFPSVPNIIWIWIQVPRQMPRQGMHTGRPISLVSEEVEADEEIVTCVRFARGKNTFGNWGGTARYK